MPCGGLPVPFACGIQMLAKNYLTFLGMDEILAKIPRGASSHDAILVHLVGGKIAAWNEYFDFGNSLDAEP